MSKVVSGESHARTAYGVNCWECNYGELVYLTQENYDQQMDNPDYGWRCPRCGQAADWNDGNYEDFFEDQDEQDV